jgi:transmembrane sensor
MSARVPLKSAFAPVETDSRHVLTRAQHTRRTRRRRSTALAATAAALAVLAGVGVLTRPHLSPAPEGTVFAAGDVATTLTLRENSQVALSPGAQLKLASHSADDVQLELLTGKASFQVTHGLKRRFRVQGGEVEVEVVGTRFTMERTNAGSTVSVQEGVVKVSSKTGVVELRANQRWPAMPLEVAEPAVALPPDELEDEDTEEVEVAPSPSAPPAAPGQRHRTHRRRPLAAKVAPQQPAPAAAQEPAPVLVADAELLFKQARAQRTDGQFALAATTLVELMQRFPQDERAPLAAFELARLRMDHLRDDAGALEPLRLAVKRLPKGELLEAAFARQVGLFRALHRSSDCQQAQDAYRAQFPAGVHESSVRIPCD